MRLLVILSFLLTSDITLAAGGGHGIPWPTITAQVVNVIIAIALLIYFLRKPVAELFVGRVETFDAEFKKAQAQKEEAENKRNEINSKLKQLKVSADQSILEAKEQAKLNREKLLQETELAANKMISDSEAKVQTQLNKIVGDLKIEILGQAFDRARDGLSDNISQPELNRLKQEFIKNIQVVQ